MAPIGLFLATALLALCGVDAAKDKVRFYEWHADGCSGMPSDKGTDLVLGECKNIHVRSLKFSLPKKDKDRKWIDQINSGNQECLAHLFTESDCKPGVKYVVPGTYPPQEASVPLPKDFGLCYRHTDQAIRSVKFSCQPKLVVAPHSQKTTLTYTSWAVHSLERPTPIEHTFTTDIAEQQFNLSMPGPTVAAYANGENHAYEKVAEAPKPRSPLRSYNPRGVWYKHPWSDSALCFECWLKHEHNDINFHCQYPSSGQAPCGVQPKLSTTTIVKNAILTEKATTTEMLLMYDIPSPSPQPLVYIGPVDPGESRGLERRSSDSGIFRINHPYRGESTCAKAKWKHIGKPGAQITLDGPKNCHNRERPSINLPGPFSTTTTHYTSTTTQSFTTTVATAPIPVSEETVTMVTIPEETVTVMPIPEETVTVTPIPEKTVTVTPIPDQTVTVIAKLSTDEPTATAPIPVSVKTITVIAKLSTDNPVTTAPMPVKTVTVTAKLSTDKPRTTTHGPPYLFTISPYPSTYISTVTVIGREL